MWSVLFILHLWFLIYVEFILRYGIQFDFFPTIFFIYWSLNSGLCACWQMLHHLSYTSSPFYSSYFADKVSLFAQASLNHNHPILCFLTLLE
jgi:hypothetical protein